MDMKKFPRKENQCGGRSESHRAVGGMQGE